MATVPEENPPYRCFVTSVVVDSPERNRFAGTVYYKQDHGGPVRDRAYIEGSFKTAHADDYRVGDVINVTLA